MTALEHQRQMGADADPRFQATERLAAEVKSKATSLGRRSLWAYPQSWVARRAWMAIAASR